MRNLVLILITLFAVLIAGCRNQSPENDDYQKLLYTNNPDVIKARQNAEAVKGTWIVLYRDDSSVSKKCLILQRMHGADRIVMPTEIAEHFAGTPLVTDDILTIRYTTEPTKKEFLACRGYLVSLGRITDKSWFLLQITADRNGGHG